MVQEMAEMNALGLKHPFMVSACLLFLFYSLLFSQMEGDKRVITGEAIRQAGLIRLNELFLLIDEWQGNSVDGFDWRLSPNALETVQQQNWLILLNGHPFPVTLLHTNNLNLLPVSVEQIDSVVVINTPSLYHNAFSDRGIIHIYSAKKEDGLALHGRMALGNETGDPGPYRYTPYKTPNRDRVAHDESFGLSYAFQDLYLGLHQKNLVHYPTSESILQRVWYPLTGDDYPRIDVNATFFDGYYKKHQWHVGYTFNRDHLFVKPFGREIPVNRTLIFGALNGIVAWNIRYALSYHNSYCFERDNMYHLNFDRRIQYLQVQTWRQFNHTYVGLGFQQYRLTSGYLQGTKKSNMLKCNLAHKNRINNRLQQDICGQILISADFTTLKFSLGYGYDLSDTWHLHSIVAYSERHHDETDDYDGLPPGWVTIHTIEDNKKNRLASVDFYGRCKLFGSIEGMLGVKYRKHLAAFVEEQPFHYQWQSDAFTGPLTLHTSASGETVSLTAQLAYHVNRHLAHNLFYQNRLSVSGDVVFQEAWMPIPRHKLTYTIALQPFNHASIWTKLTWLSKSEWPDYRYVVEESDGKYRDHTPEILKWDLALQKSIWKKRLRGSLVFRNLLNKIERYHPAGAVHYLRFYVQVELDIHSLWAVNH
jgi:hypothetical protein